MGPWASWLWILQGRSWAGLGVQLHGLGLVWAASWWARGEHCFICNTDRQQCRYIVDISTRVICIPHMIRDRVIRGIGNYCKSANCNASIFCLWAPLGKGTHHDWWFPLTTNSKIPSVATGIRASTYTYKEGIRPNTLPNRHNNYLLYYL